jgi:hypothetical protein
MENIDDKDKEAYAELMRNLPVHNETEDKDLENAFKQADLLTDLLESQQTNDDAS